MPPIETKRIPRVGPKGRAGVKGARGLTGKTGLTGARGLIGKPGRKGVDGVTAALQQDDYLERIAAYFDDVHMQLSEQARDIADLRTQLIMLTTGGRVQRIG
jgi:hypothetical protein